MAELASAAPTSGGVSHSSSAAMTYILTYMWDFRDGYDIFSCTSGPTRSPHLDGETCSLGSSAVSPRPCLSCRATRPPCCLVPPSPLEAPSTDPYSTVSNSLSSFPAPFLPPFLYPILSLLRRPLNLCHLVSISYPPASPLPSFLSLTFCVKHLTNH